MRQVLHAVINKEEGESPEKIKPITEEENVEIKRLTIRIPVFLFDISKERAEHKGMAISRWVVSLIQSNLMSQPVMSGDELRELRGSIRELSAIGRNINQMTRSLNENYLRLKECAWINHLF